MNNASIIRIKRGPTDSSPKKGKLPLDLEHGKPISNGCTLISHNPNETGEALPWVGFDPIDLSSLHGHIVYIHL